MKAADSPMRYHSPASTVSSEALPLSAADLIGGGKKTPTKVAHEHLLHFGIEGDGAPLARERKDVYTGVRRVAAGADEELVAHLAGLYEHIAKSGRMTANMRESVTTMVYKGKGSPADPACYRPIAVTAIEYRILATAMAQRLAEGMPKLIGDSQIGFMLDRVIDENIDLMEETLRYANHEGRERGGAVAVLVPLIPLPVIQGRVPPLVPRDGHVSFRLRHPERFLVVLARCSNSQTEGPC